MASHDDPKLGFGTRAIHAGQRPDPVTGAVMTPVYYTSTYAQDAPGVHKGFEYSRTHNLTRFALEANLASLEGAAGGGLCFASGLAATSTLLQLFDAGTHVIAADDLYGGTFRLFDKVYRRFGFEFTYVDPLHGAAGARIGTGAAGLVVTGVHGVTALWGKARSIGQPRVLRNRGRALTKMTHLLHSVLAIPIDKTLRAAPRFDPADTELHAAA